VGEYISIKRKRGSERRRRKKVGPNKKTSSRITRSAKNKQKDNEERHKSDSQIIKKMSQRRTGTESSLLPSKKPDKQFIMYTPSGSEIRGA
jgi:hypothetical protein